MTHSQRELRHIVRRAEDGHITAVRATELAVAQGYLAIGTALTKEGYTPGVPLTAGDGENLLGWRPRVVNERRGTIPIVRAGRVAKTAVWAAFGGDVNEVFQRNRVGRPVLPEGRVYDLGSQGWLYDERTGVYTLQAHPDLVRAGQGRQAELPIGVIDFVEDDGSFGIEIVREPGHLASTASHETLATIPVRYGDVQAELGAVSTALYDYEPLRL